MTISGLSTAPDLLTERNEAGGNRILRFRDDGTPVTVALPKPGSAPKDVYGTRSNRWLRGVPREDARLRLWDATALPGARPLELRREGSWYWAHCDIDPADRLVVVTTHEQSRLTFWPLPVRWPSIVDGYKPTARPLAFSPDSHWLATGWADGRLRLWPLPGSGANDVKVFDVPPIEAGLWEALSFDPASRYLFAVGMADNAWIVPLDGSSARQLHAFSAETLLEDNVAAVSPTGHHVATAFSFGKGSKTLRVWDVESGALRLFPLPQPSPPGGVPPAPTGYEAGVWSVAFLDDSTLFTAGDGGVRRWNLDTGTHELVMPVSGMAGMWMTDDRRQAFILQRTSGLAMIPGLKLLDLATGASLALPEHGDSVSCAAAGPRGLVASGSLDGTIRVARRPGEGPRILLGHSGRVDRLAISPDGLWLASTGEDSTLRLWPMPDLDKPPLQTLPHDDLLAKLRSLTNLRAVRDPKSSTGWSIELGPFPGWKDVPSW